MFFEGILACRGGKKTGRSRFKILLTGLTRFGAAGQEGCWQGQKGAATAGGDDYGLELDRRSIEHGHGGFAGEPVGQKEMNKPQICAYAGSTPLTLCILLFVMECHPLFAKDTFPGNLGSGDPGLHVIYNTTNQYVIYLNDHWEVGNVHSGAYAVDLSQGNYPRRHILLKAVQDIYGGEPEELYPFDEETAFTCNGGAGWSPDGKTYHYWPRKTQVFSTNENAILISTDVYRLAHARYGLKTNELFLGKIGTNIFYWKPPDTMKVFYRDTNESGAIKFFKLPKHIRDIFGITSALISKKDVAICVSRRTSGLVVVSSPYEDAVFEFSFRDAKPVKGSQ